MKAALPCYNFLYKHSSQRLRTKIDQREELVAQIEQAQTTCNQAKNTNRQSKMAKLISHTLITKRLLNLFIQNMSANDNNEEKQENKD